MARAKKKQPELDLPNTKEIGMYLHCGLCVHDVMHGDMQGKVTPRNYARLSVGWTKQGLQVWCERHEVNVIHIHFEGATHFANLTRKPTPHPAEGCEDCRRIRGEV